MSTFLHHLVTLWGLIAAATMFVGTLYGIALLARWAGESNRRTLTLFFAITLIGMPLIAGIITLVDS